MRAREKGIYVERREAFGGKRRSDTSRSLTLKLKVGSFANPKIRATPKPKLDLDEPEVLGPPNDFPPRGTCQYTKDDVAKPDWRMCGHPGFPWCEWHLEKRIKPQAA